MALPLSRTDEAGRSGFDSSARGLNVDINLLRAAPAKQPASENKKPDQNEDYEDRHHRNHTRASAATILSHKDSSS